MEIDTIPINSLSKENQKIYQEWFNYADADGDGRLTGSDAIKFFAMSGLSRQDLKQVWAIADSKRQGYLGFQEFMVAMQVVSLAQSGHTITHDLLTSGVDLENLKPPQMEGLDVLLAKKKHKQKDHDANGSSQLQPSLSANWFSSKSTKKGWFEILSLSGSFMPNESEGARSRSGGMSVSLASIDGRVVRGGMAGLLVATSPMQVVVGSFLAGNQHEQKPKK